MQFDYNDTAQYSMESETVAISSNMGSFRFTKPIAFDLEISGNGIILGNAEADPFA